MKRCTSCGAILICPVGEPGGTNAARSRPLTSRKTQGFVASSDRMATPTNLRGSEIEAVFVEALHDAFDGGGEPSDLSIASVLTTFVPLSEMMKEQLSALRACVKAGRVRLRRGSRSSSSAGLRRSGAFREKRARGAFL